MSEKMTSISITGDDGLMVYGYKSRAEMISQYKTVAQHKLSQAQIVLSAKDEDFIVEQHKGVFVRRDVKPLI